MKKFKLFACYLACILVTMVTAHFIDEPLLIFWCYFGIGVLITWTILA
jgi:hypothetical protein